MYSNTTKGKRQRARRPKAIAKATARVSTSACGSDTGLPPVADEARLRADPDEDGNEANPRMAKSAEAEPPAGAALEDTKLSAFEATKLTTNLIHLNIRCAAATEMFLRMSMIVLMMIPMIASSKSVWEVIDESASCARTPIRS